MSSAVEICNLALSHLGDDATIASIDPPEGSAQAEHCAMFYPLARDALLEMHSWRFATKRSLLAELVSDGWGWQYVYAQPINSLRVLSILPASAHESYNTADYDIKTTSGDVVAIYTNLPDASALYLSKVEDSGRFSPLFTDALSRLLASYLAGPVIKGDSGAKMAQTQYQAFRMVLGQAINSDASQRHGEIDHNPSWMEAR